MARGKGGLGRGLDSLFEDAAPVFESGAKVDTLPLREIEPDPEQPRKTFDEETLGELAASIAEHGLLQPIAVRPRPRGGYSICLLYTSPSPRDRSVSRMPSSA